MVHHIKSDANQWCIIFCSSRNNEEKGTWLSEVTWDSIFGGCVSYHINLSFVGRFGHVYAPTSSLSICSSSRRHRGIGTCTVVLISMATWRLGGILMHSDSLNERISETCTLAVGYPSEAFLLVKCILSDMTPNLPSDRIRSSARFAGN